MQLYKNIELQTLRDNVPLLASMGRSFYMNGDVQQSISCFEKVGISRFLMNSNLILSHINEMLTSKT